MFVKRGSLCYTQKTVIKKVKIGLFALLSTAFVIGGVFLIYHYLSNQKAVLVIETNVSSQVYINDRQVGKTPFEGEFEQKEVDLKLIPESFEQALVPYETRIKLTSGVKTIVRREFGAEEGSSSGVEVSFDRSVNSEASIAVVTEPTGAKVYIDDVFVDVAPAKSSDLTNAIYKVVIEAEGYGEKSVMVQAQKGYLLTVFADLAKVALPKEDDMVNLQQLEDENKQETVQILDTPIGFLRVRSNPSTLSSEIAQVEPEDEYSLLEISEDEDWYKIQLDEEIEGWVSVEYAKIK